MEVPMEKTVTEKSLDGIEQKLARYQGLMERKNTLLKWLENAEKNRSTVNDKIYQKVKAEYNRQLSETVSDLSPIEKEIGDERESAQRRRAETEEDLNALQDQQAESAFRHRIGEYDGDKLREIETSLSPLIEEKKQQENTLSTLLRRIDEAMQDDEPHPEGSGTFADEVISGLADPVDDGTPENATGIGSSQNTADTQNPSARPEGAALSNSPAQEKDSLLETAALETSQADEDQMIPFPNLIITSGKQSGKKIPLLPMTMTIGREHDNNIELKDEEVARYHARVVYQDHRFVLQDLNSSTGTWVNEEQITQASLKNTDKIRLGKTEMIIDFN
jgi:hypothetical protein